MNSDEERAVKNMLRKINAEIEMLKKSLNHHGVIFNDVFKRLKDLEAELKKLMKVIK